MKERLTGAIILVALLVLLVPELLTGPSPKPGSRPAGAEGAQLRSYTIDLQDDAAGRSPPTSAPATVVADDPVGRAAVEPDAESPPAANVTPPVDEATRETGKPMGSGADVLAAAPPGATLPASAKSEAPTSAAGAKSPAGAVASADDDKPRSAFGPNAVTRPQPEKPASSTGTNATRAPEPSRPSSAKVDGPKSGSAKTAASKAEASKAEVAKAGSASAEVATGAGPKAAASKSDALRVAAAKPADAPKAAGSQGWAVQLGVFASRENADRLAKEVKGSGYPVVVNEISGNGKKLYRVRVGPEADRAAAVALGTRLRSAGHAGSVVPYP